MFLFPAPFLTLCSAARFHALLLPRPYGQARGLMRCLSYRVSLYLSSSLSASGFALCSLLLCGFFRAHFDFCSLGKFEFSAALFHNYERDCMRSKHNIIVFWISYSIIFSPAKIIRYCKEKRKHCGSIGSHILIYWRY